MSYFVWMVAALATGFTGMFLFAGRRRGTLPYKRVTYTGVNGVVYKATPRNRAHTCRNDASEQAGAIWVCSCRRAYRYRPGISHEGNLYRLRGHWWRISWWAVWNWHYYYRLKQLTRGKKQLEGREGI